MISRVITLLLLAAALGRPLYAQQTNCEEDENYSISNVTINGVQAKRTANTKGSAQLTFGSPFSGITNQPDLDKSLVGGFFGFYQLEPQAPIVQASQGEYLDRIEISWEIIDDRIGPMVTGTEAQIWRNDRLYTSVPLAQTTFVDYNVFPGEFYTYEIVSTNLNGDSRTLPVVGFLNPNGRITGTIETRLGSPVLDAKVTLDPDLGRCLEFDGVDDYAFFTDEIFALNDYYTIEAWWRNVDVKDQTILSLLDSGTTTPVVKITLTENGTVKWYHDGNADGTGTTLESRLAYNLTAFDRKWHHVAAVNDTTKMYLYVDGKRVAEADFSEGMTERMTMELGKDGKNQFAGYYSGQLDDLRFWNVGRTRADIRKYMDITLTGEEEYLDTYYKFDEQYGDKIYDYVEKPVTERHHGYICDVLRSDLSSPAVLGAYTDEGGDYIIKGVYYGNGQTFAVNVSKETPIGFSLKMDGIDDYISYHFDRFDYSDAFTLEGWFKSAVSGDMTIYQVTDPDTDNELFSIGLNNAGNFVVNSAFDGSNANITSTTAYNDEFWYHYAVTYDGSSMKLYVNSQEVGSTGVGAFDPIQTRYVIGRSGAKDSDAGSSYFNGWIDEMRLWNYARTATQVSATQNQVIPGDEQGIVDPEGDLGVWAYWNLSEGQGSVITDATPNSHAGDLKNAQIVDIDGEEIVTNWEGDDIPLQVEFFKHDFDPNSRNVSLDPSVTAVDRVDFTDISQLAVSGFVRFEGTNCFTDSVEVFVNGSPTLPGTFSDKSGKFALEFEPGSQGNIITFAKEDHTFVPNFIELPRLVRPIAGLGIANTTDRKLSGKVVGGNCKLPIGLEGDIRVIVSTQPYCYSDTAQVDASGNFEFGALPPQKYTVFVEHSNPTIQTYFDTQGAKEVSLLKSDKEVEFNYRSPLQMELTGKEVSCFGEVIFEQGLSENIEISVFEEYLSEKCLVSSGQLTINDDIAELPEPFETEFTNGAYTYKTKPGQPNVLDGGSRPFQKRIAVFATDDISRSVTAEFWVIVTGEKPRESDFTTTAPEIPSIILRAPPGDQSYAWIEEGTTIKNSLQLDVALDDETKTFGKAKLGAKVVTQAGAPGLTLETEAKTEKYKATDWTTGSTVKSSFEVEREFTITNRIETKPNEGDVYVGGAMNILYGKTDIITFNEATCEIEKSEDIAFYPDDFATTFTYSENFLVNSLIPELEALGKTADATMWKKIILMNYALKQRAKFVENLSFDAGIGLQKENSATISGRMTYETTVFLEPDFVVGAGLEVNGNGTGFGRNHRMRLSQGQSDVTTQENTRTIGYYLADDDFGDNFTVNIKEDPIYGTPVFDLVSSGTSCPFEGYSYEYPGDLSGLAIDPQVQDLGIDLVWKPASDVLNGSTIGTIKKVISGIEEVVGLVGIDLGITDAIDEATDLSFLDDKISEFYGVKTGHDNPSGTIMDFYVAAFDEKFKLNRGVKREGVDLSVNRNIATNVPEDLTAIFELSLGNVSETDEPAVYYLTALQESNPDGAVIRVNGQPLTGTQDLAFTLQPGQQLKVTLEVEKGPLVYEHNDLELMLFSSCEKERAEALGFNLPEAPFASRVKISARFIEVCSPITIFNPGDDWVITQANNNMLNVSLIDYILDRPDFTEIKLQYRQKIEGQPWINAVEMLKADLDPVVTILPWNVTSLDDGIYELRAMTFCDAVPDPRSSEVLTGTIDRKAPELFGTPSPIDAVLGRDDQISIEFDEAINCADIISLAIPVSLTEGEANNVAISNTETGLFIEGIVTCEGNKLIIVPDIQNKFLEEQVIRVDVLGMTDELGNQQKEAITWEFLVRRNPLAWQGGDIQKVVYEGESSQFVRQIKNNGGFAVNVNLSGQLDVQTLNETPLPNWLTASPRSFQLQPGATQDVTFTVSDQLGGGSYNDMVTAATSFGAPELRFDVRVLCQEPSWSVNASDFEYSTTLTGQLDIRGELSEDEFDLVAAYVGDELRGVGKVIYAPELAAIPGEHPYLVFMTLYSNSTNTEEIDFQVWDASRCQLYGQVAENYQIGATVISLGSPTNPSTITVTNNVVQKISMNKGWNWISFNLNLASSDVNDVLGNMENVDRGAIVKSQTGYSQYVPNVGWLGPLAKIDSTKAYRIKLTSNDVLELSGMPIDFETTQIKLDSGWNWVSFLPPVGMEINQALSSLSATADFIIKGQNEFAQYVDFQGWIGSLDFLRPNNGYLIYTDREQNLKYPVTDANSRIIEPQTEETLLPEGWALDPSDFEFNSNYVFRVDGINVETGDLLGLFDQDRLIGFGEAQYLEFNNSHYFFVTAYGNSPSSDLTAVLSKGSDMILLSGSSLTFSPEMVSGSIVNPILLKGSSVLNVVDLKSAVDIYPNPGSTETTLQLHIGGKMDVEFVIHNIMGQQVDKIDLGTLNAGYHQVTLSQTVNNQKLPSGIYFVRVQIGNEVYTRKLIWK